MILKTKPEGLKPVSEFAQSSLIITVKILKIGTPKIITGMSSGTVGFYSAVLRSKDADRITNRVDPDQTAKGAV